jgi:hypothetical protein
MVEFPLARESDFRSWNDDRVAHGERDQVNIRRNRSEPQTRESMVAQDGETEVSGSPVAQRVLPDACLRAYRTDGVECHLVEGDVRRCEVLL